jgi:hypothetical protein
MRTHRIPFKEPMVRAILAGEKTETRRARPRPIDVVDEIAVCEDLIKHAPLYGHYSADDHWTENAVPWPWKVRSLPARYCPNWAIRIRRRVVEVRMERLGDISEESAIAEGMRHLGRQPIPPRKWMLAWNASRAVAEGLAGWSYRDVYRLAWEGLHGSYDPDQVVQVIRWEVSHG